MLEPGFGVSSLHVNKALQVAYRKPLYYARKDKLGPQLHRCEFLWDERTDNIS